MAKKKLISVDNLGFGFQIDISQSKINIPGSVAYQLNSYTTPNAYADLYALSQRNTNYVTHVTYTGKLYDGGSSYVMATGWISPGNQGTLLFYRDGNSYFIQDVVNEDPSILNQLNTTKISGEYLGIGSSSNHSNRLGDGAVAADSVAIGPGAYSSGQQCIAIGKSSDTGDTSNPGEASISIGSSAKSSNTNSVSIGTGASAIGARGSILPKKGYSVSIGSSAKSDGQGSTAVGYTSNSYGTVSVSIGAHSKALGDRSVAIGGAAPSNGPLATMTDSIAIGHMAKSTVAGGVAIGSSSTTDRATSLPGYNPTDGYPSTYNVSGTTRGSLGSFSVGNQNNTRQVINVAAGTNDDDAVNVAQLKALFKALLSSRNTYTGPGRPDRVGTLDEAGKVFVQNAEPLYTFISNDGAGVKAWRWERNTGGSWRITAADTGWITISSIASNKPNIKIRRINYTVYIAVDQWAGNRIQLPNGFGTIHLATTAEQQADKDNWLQFPVTTSSTYGTAELSPAGCIYKFGSTEALPFPGSNGRYWNGIFENHHNNSREGAKALFQFPTSEAWPIVLPQGV